MARTLRTTPPQFNAARISHDAMLFLKKKRVKTALVLALGFKTWAIPPKADANEALRLITIPLTDADSNIVSKATQVLATFLEKNPALANHLSHLPKEVKEALSVYSMRYERLKQRTPCPSLFNSL